MPTLCKSFLCIVKLGSGVKAGARSTSMSSKKKKKAASWLGSYTHFKPVMTGPVPRYAERTEERREGVWDTAALHGAPPPSDFSWAHLTIPQLCVNLRLSTAFPVGEHTHSRWCLPDPGRTAGLWGEPPPPSARAQDGCWGPRWSRHCSGSAWRGQRTCHHKHSEFLGKTKSPLTRRNIGYWTNFLLSKIQKATKYVTRMLN